MWVYLLYLSVVILYMYVKLDREYERSLCRFSMKKEASASSQASLPHPSTFHALVCRRERNHCISKRNKSALIEENDLSCSILPRYLHKYYCRKENCLGWYRSFICFIVSHVPL